MSYSRWEYTLVSFNTGHYKEDRIEKELNELGNEGWEAVSIVLLPNQWTRVMFKRKVVN